MLVAPSGMNGEERAGWVAVARQSLSGIPADLLKQGCAKARLTCRFASEIVPAIHSEVGKEWERRKKRAAEDEAAYRNRHAPRLEQHEPELVDPAEVRNLINSIALNPAGER